MAYLVEDDKQQQNGQNQSPNTMGAQVSGGAPAIVSGGGGGGVSQAGVGKGGTGGWTNIQAYLGANEGNKQGSANLLQNKVGQTFQSEASRLAEESNKAKQEAATKVSENTLSRDQAKEKLNSLAGQYNYKAPQSEEYNQGVNKLKTASTYQYDGPTSFSYGMGGQTQEYGSGLNSDPAFSQIMTSLYGQAANGQLGRGQATLQKQLDVNNEQLAGVRDNLRGQYGQLQQNVADTTRVTDESVRDAARMAAENVNSVNNYLGDTRSQSYQDLQAATKAWNDAERARANAASIESGYQVNGPRGMGIVNPIEVIGRSGYDVPINNDRFFTYRPGDAATLESVSGQDTNRNIWNVVGDVRGLEDKINDAYDVSAGAYEFDQNKRSNRIAEARAMWSAGYGWPQIAAFLRS